MRLIGVLGTCPRRFFLYRSLASIMYSATLDESGTPQTGAENISLHFPCPRSGRAELAPTDVTDAECGGSGAAAERGGEVGSVCSPVIQRTPSRRQTISQKAVTGGLWSMRLSATTWPRCCRKKRRERV